MLWKLNKICCPNICVLQPQKKSMTGPRMHCGHSFCPGLTLRLQGACGLHCFLNMLFWSIPLQPFLNISQALEELSFGLRTSDIVGSCPCWLVETTNVRIINLCLGAIGNFCWKRARTALNFSREGQRGVIQYFPQFLEKELSSASMNSQIFSLFLLPMFCYFKILVTLAQLSESLYWKNLLNQYIQNRSESIIKMYPA